MTFETNPFDPSEHDVHNPHAPAQSGGAGLAAFDEEYAQAEAPDFDEVPDGKYQVRVESARMAQSQKGAPMIKWDLVIITGPLEGRHIFKNSVITPSALPFVKGDLKTLGLQLARFSDLPNHLEELLDKRLQITKKTRDEFANVYFNKLLLASDSGGSSGDPAPF